MKRIGIIGTRKRNIRTDYQLVCATFLDVWQEGDWIVSGHCPKGGDAFAEKIAFDYGIPILLFPPKKHTREEFFARNTLIADHSDILIACLVNPTEPLEGILSRKSGGSEDTIRKFMKRQGYMSFHLKEGIDVPDDMRKKVIIV